MTISANTLGKLLGHEPVEPLDVPGRVIQNLDSLPPPKPAASEKPTAAEPVQVKTAAEKQEDKRARQREYNRRYLEKKKAQQLALAQKLAIQIPAGAIGLPYQELASDLESVSFKGVDIDQVKQQEPGPVTVMHTREEQRFEVSGHSAFRIAQAMFDEDLLTCSMVIEGQKLQFIFTVKAKS